MICYQYFISSQPFSAPVKLPMTEIVDLVARVLTVDVKDLVMFISVIWLWLCFVSLFFVFVTTEYMLLKIKYRLSWYNLIWNSKGPYHVNIHPLFKLENPWCIHVEFIHIYTNFASLPFISHQQENSTSETVSFFIWYSLFCQIDPYFSQ